jgi:capsular polysaccharide biosynthesis protein
MEETISFQELAQTIKKRLGMILAITFIAAVISGVVSYLVLTPVYQATTQLLVNQEKSEVPTYNVGDIQTNLQLINTYNVIIKSPAILKLVVEDLALEDMSVEALNSKIAVSSVGDSQVVTINVNDPDPYIARDIANTTASIFQKEIVNLMNVNNVSILAEATASDLQQPIKPNPVLNMAIALVVGLMLGVGLAFLLEYLDNTIKTDQDIETLLELPVLGGISSMERKEQDKMMKKQSKRQKKEGLFNG